MGTLTYKLSVILIFKVLRSYAHTHAPIKIKFSAKMLIDAQIIAVCTFLKSEYRRVSKNNTCVT